MQPIRPRQPKTIAEFLFMWKRNDARAAVLLAYDFYKRHEKACGYDRYDQETKAYDAAWTEARIVGDLACIDFNYPISFAPIPAGTKLQSFRDRRRSPYKGNWFHRGDFIPTQLGILGYGNLGFDGRFGGPLLDKVVVRYTVEKEIPIVMTSISQSVFDTFSRQGYEERTRGGGEQILIPESARYMRTSMEMATKSRAYEMRR